MSDSLDINEDNFESSANSTYSLLGNEVFSKSQSLRIEQLIPDSEEDQTFSSEDEDVIKTVAKKSRNVIFSSSDEETDKPENLFENTQRKKSDPASGKQADLDSDSENEEIISSKNNASVLCSSSDDETEVNQSTHIQSKSTLSDTKVLNKSNGTPKTFKQKEIETPRKMAQILSSSEASNDDSDVIDGSDEESSQIQNTPYKVLKQPTLKEYMQKENFDNKKEFIEVCPQEYEKQSAKVKQIDADFYKTIQLIKKINLEHLPDKGENLKKRALVLEKALEEETIKFSQMKVTKEDPPKNILSSQNRIPTWTDIEAGASNVVPRTFGKQAMATITVERKLTVDRLQQLHGSLQTCPTETDLGEPPKGLKVELMTHQKRALLWLLWREKQKPSGGILADDMGLGKTLTMISLMLKCNEDKVTLDDDADEENEDMSDVKYKGGTLVICPASLINQWSSELECRTTRGLVTCELYHGPKRETKAKRLAKHDMVITTYSIVNNECAKKGTIFKVKWRRIIIDEAHHIRNYKSQTSEAVCKLAAQSRWALTGTPVHNKQLDMYALLKFLKCSPFDDLKVWQRWVGDKSAGGTERLFMVISSLMLRRTKAELMEKGALKPLPERNWELIEVVLTDKERGVYNKILIFSRTLFAQFLHQRAEKYQDALDPTYNQNLADGPNPEYFAMRQKLLKLNKLKDIKQHEILLLLLRLRQICCHSSLITGMLQYEKDMELLGNEEENDDASALDLLDQLNRLTLTENNHLDNSTAADVSEEGSSLKEIAKTVLNPSDPVFSATKRSSKIKILIKLLREKVLIKDDKAIIVSQWTSFLNLIAYNLKEEGLKYDQLDGTVPVHKRMEMVDRFNNPKDKLKILLLSLTAGGVGLNLMGANHLFLLDLHWNPQLEKQAQDRIYRLGQEKPVFIYKMMAADTIEKRILDLQEKKLDIANSMLTGSNQTNKNKLTLQDLKMLFEM